MSTEPQDETSPAPETEKQKNVLLDFNFVPDWARTPPSTPSYQVNEREDRRYSDRGRGRDDRGRDRRPPRDRDARSRPPRDRAGQDPRDTRRAGGVPDAGVPRPNQFRGRDDSRPREERLPIQVSFIPEQEKLAAVVADIRASQRAYPIPKLAIRFLASPEAYLIKLEIEKDQTGQRAISVYQAMTSGMLFLNRDECLAHILQNEMASVFQQETIQTDPPTGSFVVVARCKLSGVLLGPPNHHGYNERVDELHRTRYAHMSADDYRRNIVTLREPDLIEQWKEEFRTKTLYRRISTKPDEVFDPMTELEAREWFMLHEATRRMREASKYIIPAKVAHEIRDPRLERLMRQAWSREQRFPATLVRALRGAFRRMGMHLFHTSPQSLYVTSIEAKPVEPEHVVENIRVALEWIIAHPGCTRRQLVHGLWPDLEQDPIKIADALQPLTWLVEKGHVIEFYDGALQVPTPPQKPKAAPEK